MLSLNEDYDGVITAKETINTTVTIEFIKPRLSDKELKIKASCAKMSASFKASPCTCCKCEKQGQEKQITIKRYEIEVLYIFWCTWLYRFHIVGTGLCGK